jgi:integral membrane sensor domain MASE1
MLIGCELDAVAGALTLGFGLIAAGISTSTSRWLLVTIMTIVVLYAVTITFSGYDFIRLQCSLREQWQNRLY